jgi:AbiV family abortive infection protein
MDLRAVKAATRPELATYAVAAAENASGLLGDAELLSGAGRHARGYSLAVLAVEEFGKAMSLMALAVMPEGLRARAPLRRMLEWHQLKLVGGQLMAVVNVGRPPCLAGRLIDLPGRELAEMLRQTAAWARDADRLKLRGLYADMDRRGRIRRPSEVTEDEVRRQLVRARQIVSPAGLIPDLAARASLFNPPAAAVETSRALVSALVEVGNASSAEAAVAVMVNSVTKLRDSSGASMDMRALNLGGLEHPWASAA